MSHVERYLEAADRPNTRRSYASALRHFEQHWKGLLPATPDTVARYLAEFASSHAVATLQLRLAALSNWHTAHGFPDPTKSDVVRQVMRGIRTVHPTKPKQARPVLLDILQHVDDWLKEAIAEARHRADRTGTLRHTRDRALLLLGFWRGFRSDELVRLHVEHIEVTHGEGLTCFIPQSKTDRHAEGRTVRCPALSRLCPVTAYADWLKAAELTAGPVFRGIDRWGHLGAEGLAANSVIPLLRQVFAAAGVADAEAYSGHSLRRGFAGWANANGWELKELMEYVGWRDIHSAIRYIDVTPQQLIARFEQGLREHAAVVPDAARAPGKPRLQLVPTSKK